MVLVANKMAANKTNTWTKHRQNNMTVTMLCTESGHHHHMLHTANNKTITHESTVKTVYNSILASELPHLNMYAKWQIL